LRSNFKLIKI